MKGEKNPSALNIYDGNDRSAIYYFLLIVRSWRTNEPQNLRYFKIPVTQIACLANMRPVACKVAAEINAI